MGVRLRQRADRVTGETSAPAVFAKEVLVEIPASPFLFLSCATEIQTEEV